MIRESDLNHRIRITKNAHVRAIDEYIWILDNHIDNDNKQLKLMKLSLASQEADAEINGIIFETFNIIYEEIQPEPIMNIGINSTYNKSSDEEKYY